MAEQDFSCIKQVVKTVQIPLPATFISNETCGIAEILDSWKRQYKKELQGVVVNYKHYSLSSSTGFIAPNKPYVYYNVKATFDLFCPKVGDVVKGRINRISKEHIGCLIEETINVTIHLSKDSPQDLSPFINLNHEILLEIFKFNYDRKMIRVTGKITPKCIELMKDLFPPHTYHNLADNPELSNNTDEGIGTSSESADDALPNHIFEDIKNNDDLNFKKPYLSNTKSKKKSSESESESSTINTSDTSTSNEKPKKKKKKHSNKTNPDAEMNLSANSPLNSVSSDTLIENFSNFNHVETLKALKEEVPSSEDNTRVKKHKKKRKKDSSSFIEKSTHSNNLRLNGDISNLDLNNSAVIKADKLSKKRKRESESSIIDTLEKSIAAEMPKKKKKRKDKTISLLENDIKNEIFDIPNNNMDTIMSLKREIFSPMKAVDVPESKKKKKTKDKKTKDKNKGKKKKRKVLASGAVLKKDKKSHKKGSKKNKLEGEQSKKSKSNKKDKSEKKKKKGSSKSKKVSDVIKSEID